MSLFGAPLELEGDARNQFVDDVAFLILVSLLPSLVAGFIVYYVTYEQFVLTKFLGFLGGNMGIGYKVVQLGGKSLIALSRSEGLEDDASFLRSSLEIRETE